MPNVPEVQGDITSITEVNEQITLTRPKVEAPLNKLPPESVANNTFLGLESIPAVKPEGEGNVALGSKALVGITTGKFNVAIGVEAANALATGVENIAIGKEAFKEGTGEANTAIGTKALEKAKGNENVAVGEGALTSATTGEKNTAIGPTTGATTTGKLNVWVGKDAGVSTTTGSENVAIGPSASGCGEAGEGNVTIGAGAGELKTGGEKNIFIGFLAGSGAGEASNKLIIGNNNKKTLIQGVMSATEASQEIGFLGHAPAKRPKVKGKRTAEFALVLKTLCEGLSELGLITDETEA